MKITKNITNHQTRIFSRDQNHPLILAADHPRNGDNVSDTLLWNEIFNGNCAIIASLIA